jgi:hypothetical protein|tara:strand:- start:705 stop:1052 length:348 start_codon:yes stop_codon:yes gene_type:complete
MKAFAVSIRGGFQMAIGDKVISVMFGKMNYCENRGVGDRPWSDDAEVAIIDRKSGDIIGDVRGWQSSEEVAAIISQLYEESRQREEVRNTEDKTKPMSITGTRIECNNTSITQEK